MASFDLIADILQRFLLILILVENYNKFWWNFQERSAGKNIILHVTSRLMLVILFQIFNFKWSINIKSTNRFRTNDQSLRIYNCWINAKRTLLKIVFLQNKTRPHVTQFDFPQKHPLYNLSISIWLHNFKLSKNC